MICATCNQEIFEEAVFCPHCCAPVEGAEECTDYQFEAFISYRHCEPDRTIARKLQRFLEGFRIPRNLDSPHDGRKLGKLFRDEDELPTSSSLSDQIIDALHHSRHLIVVCSPESVKSQWVQREVELFASLHGRKRIYLALVSGEPENSFPPLLLSQLEQAPDGSIRQIDTEPLAADFRAKEGKKFRPEAIRVASALIGCDFDALRQRMRVRRMQTAFLAVALAAVVAIAFGAYSFYQQQQIRENHMNSLRHESELLATEAERLLQNGDRYQAIQVALSALPDESDPDSRPLVPAAELALCRALGVYPTKGYWTPMYSRPITTDLNFMASEAGFIATVTGDENIEVHEAYYGQLVYTLKKEELLASVGETDASFEYCWAKGTNLICCYGNHAFLVQANDGSVAWHVQGPTNIEDAAVGDSYVSVLYGPTSPNGETGQATVVIYDIADGSVVQSCAVESDAHNIGNFIQCDESGSEIAFRLATGEPLTLLDTEGNRANIPITGDSLCDVRLERGNAYVISETEELSGSCFVEAFDSSGTRLWTHEDVITGSTDLTGLPYAAGNKVVEINSDGSGAENLLVIISNAMVSLDLATGAQTNRLSFSHPILDLKHFEGFYSGVLANGTVFTKGSLFDEVLAAAPLESLTGNSLSQAKIVQCDGMGIFLVSRSVSPSEITVHSLRSGALTNTTEKETAVPSGSNVYTARSNACAISTDGITFLSDNLEEQVGSVPATDLPLINWEAYVAATITESGEAFVWGLSNDGGKNVALYRLSPTGEVITSTVIADAMPDTGPGSFDTDLDSLLSLLNNGLIGWNTGNRIVLLDQEDLSIRREVPASEDSTIDGACYGNGAMIVLEHAGTNALTGRLRYVSIATGEELPSAVGEYSFRPPQTQFSDIYTAFYRLYATNGAATAVNKDATKAAIACSDGKTRLFDLADGSLIWESSEISPNPIFLAFTDVDSNLVVQSEDQHCNLASSKDGSILASTMAELPPINACVRQNDELMVVLYGGLESSENRGFAVIAVDEAEFGPILDVGEGVAVSPDGYSFLTKSGRQYSKYRVYSLQNLLSLAHTVIENHQLTEAELAYYQIENRQR